MADIGNACGDDPSAACDWVFQQTHNKWLAGAAEWVVAKPLTVLAVIAGAFIASRLSRWFIKRSMIQVLGSRSEHRRRWLRDKTPSALLHTEEWSLRADARVQALTAVFRSIASIIIWFTALIWILAILEINLRPLIAGSAIVGVALGFGAQNIVRDFLGGIFLVIEDQFGVGDIVDLGGDTRGTVEKITLRATRIRDVKGTVWHIPNGEIRRVGNKSQEWARALLDIEVDAANDFNLVRSVISETASEFVEDERWAVDVLEPPEVWGIEAFTSDGYVVRLVLKTRPASQFGVMRELRARLKVAFDEAGVTLPSGRTDTTGDDQQDADGGQGSGGSGSGRDVPLVHPRRIDPSAT